MNALPVEVERKSDEVHIASSLSVAKQRSFDTISLKWELVSKVIKKPGMYALLPFELVQQLLQHTRLKTMIQLACRAV